MEYNIHLDEALLEHLILHKVGNKARDEGYRVAEKLFSPKEDLESIMMNYFLGQFKMEALYEFNHEADLSMNEVYNFCNAIFENPQEAFKKESINMLQFLYEKSNHPSVKGGEFYVAYFKDCVVDDEVVDAIGIFKAEDKDTYLKLGLNEEQEWIVDYEQGANTNKLDKGCLVFNIDKETGYRIANISIKGSFESKCWNDDFLTITQVRDTSWQTRAFLDLCKDFAKQGFKEDSKANQVNFVNRSKDYFEHYKEFNEAEFKEIVFEDNHDKIDGFDIHKQDFQNRLNIEDEEIDDFFISKPVVKKAKRGLKNVIELDTQMEIKVTSSLAQAEGYLERGFDEEKKMQFYKVYFNTEK